MADNHDDSTLTAGSTSQPPSSKPAIAAPLRLHGRERYEVVGEHGRGGIGRVSRARDKELGRVVAIKELIRGGDLHEVRFLREAMITARLEHPGIVPIHEAGRWEDGTPFYAMKLVSGRPLKDLIAACTTAEQRLALLPHVIAVADAIAYAHGQQIIHRDLKPANVVVGAFGETVVIDWGLAKDLSTTDDLPAAMGSPRTAAASDLTTEGTVVGTPAYMAPEQARGDAVDRRVDVFAIGAMLWELCAGTRVPPDDSGARRRVLRRAGIDPDLATVIDKAVAGDPAQRYPDAGALAADLKAFHAGARIAARSYSLPALLAHWTRRHRALAISVATAAAIAIVGSVAFVRGIATERDRAERTAGELTLQHAELQLRSDPTAAMAILATYHGADLLQLRRLRAEAIGRGVASAFLQPHGNPVWFLAGDAHGAIFSVSEDRTVRLTRDGKTTVLASDVATPAILTHASSAHVMAYGTPTGISVVALSSYAITPIATTTPLAMDIAPDGSKLAAIGSDGAITVWSLVPPVAIVHQERVPDARHLEFITPDRVFVQRRDALQTVELDPHHAVDAIALPSGRFEVGRERIAISDQHGVVSLLSPELALLARVTACQKAATAVNLVPRTDLVAFACAESIAGVARYDAAAGTLTVVDTFATQEQPFRARADELGRYVVVGDNSNVAYVYDVETKLVTRYEGQPTEVSCVTPSAPDFDHILIGDMHGGIRAWDPPARDARKLLEAPAPVIGVAFAADGASLISNATDGIVRHVRLADGAVTEWRGHTGSVARASFSPDGRSVLSYGGDRTARVWRASDGAPVRVVADHASVVTAAAYVEGGRRVVSTGRDGRLLVWTPEVPGVSVVFEQPLPLAALEVLAHNDHVVVVDSAGSIWDVALDGAARRVRTGDAASVTILRASPDGHLLATGTDKGDAVVYETAGWTAVQTLQLGSGVRQLRFDPKDRDLIIATEDRRVRAVALGGARTLPWHEIPMAARNIAYAPDGETLALVGVDGGAWFYDVRRDLWAYALDHASEVFSGAFSPDGARFASSDRRGIVTIRDVAATLARAAAGR